ncbi:MAG: hypothetical protein RL095_66 [Verrucomicrobiota bacterium]|jgi:Mg2+ and Co2+ transporter CorA
MPHTRDLPEGIRQMLGNNAGQRQRYIEHNGLCVIVLHRPPRRGDKTREALIFWKTTDGVWHNSSDNSGLGLARRNANDYEKRVAELDSHYAKADGDLQAHFGILGDLAPFSRALSNASIVMQSARDHAKNDAEIAEIADLVYSCHRSAELLQTDLHHSVEHLRAEQQERLATASDRALRSSQRLNILTAIFLPVTAITGVFGMNLHNGFENHPSMFFVVFVSGLVVGLILCTWILTAHRK